MKVQKVPSYLDHIPLDPGSTHGADISLACRPEESPSRPKPAWLRRCDGMGFSQSPSEDGESSWSWACSCSVCACRCGPMQVRQCAATVDLTGRDQGHVHSSEPMASHRIESNRSISHMPSSRRHPSLSAGGHRCPTLVADWPPPKRVSLTATAGMGGFRSGYGFTVERREVCATLG